MSAARASGAKETLFLPLMIISGGHINDDVMVYGLYSEGFRAGGVNRNRGAPRLPQAYTADFLETIQEMTMFEKHFPKDQLDQLVERLLLQ